MDKNDVIGTGQIAGGGYLAYKGVSHGLPRALGIRTTILQAKKMLNL